MGGPFTALTSARRAAATPIPPTRGGRLEAVPDHRHDGDTEAGISPVWEVEPHLGQGGRVVGHRRLARRNAIARRALGLSDVLAAAAAVKLTLDVLPPGGTSLRPAAVILIPFVILVSKALGLYDSDQHRLRKTTLDEAPSLLHLAVFFALFVWLVEGVVLTAHLSRGQVFVLTAGSLAMTLVGRAATRGLTLAISRPERCLIVGNAGIANHTAEKLAHSSGVNADVVGRVSIHPHDAPGALPVLGTYASLGEVISRHAIERVIIAPDGHDQDKILHCIRLTKALVVNVSVLPRLLEVVGTSSVFDDVEGTALLGIRQYGLSKSSEILKRGMDIVGASLALLALAPALALIAVAIRLDSKGSPFFRQSRVGRRGERFGMLKFRTMVSGADQMKDHVRGLNDVEGGLFKCREDPRITRVGRILRRSSLDELPQLVNVLRGEMSLVGPRPLVADEDELCEGWERRRLAVKPGITGLWQIFGAWRLPKQEMVKIDYFYGANWSIWLDLKILLRTVPFVLARRGL